MNYLLAIAVLVGWGFSLAGAVAFIGYVGVIAFGWWFDRTMNKRMGK